MSNFRQPVHRLHLVERQKARVTLVAKGSGVETVVNRRAILLQHRQITRLTTARPDQISWS